MINAFTSDGSRIAELPTLSVSSSDWLHALYFIGGIALVYTVQLPSGLFPCPDYQLGACKEAVNSSLRLPFVLFHCKKATENLVLLLELSGQRHLVDNLHHGLEA